MNFVEDIKKNIDTNEDIKVDIDEINKALEPNGFLDNETNVQNLAKEIEKQEKDEIINSLESSLELSLETLMEQEKFSLDDMKILDLCYNIFDEDTKEKIKDKTTNVVEEISHKVNKTIGVNAKETYGKRYSKEDIMHIQFWANINFGENIEIDGNRGEVHYSSQNNENQLKTNAYIYRLEIKNRQDVIDMQPELLKNILNIPNLEGMLSNIPNTEDQNKVFSEFLNFFLLIKASGMYFESQIGGGVFEAVLNTMILSETNKDISVDEYYSQVDPKPELYHQLKKAGVTNMGEYYSAKYKELMSNIINQNNINVENNKTLWEQNNINTKLTSIFDDITSAEKIEKQTSTVYTQLGTGNQKRYVAEENISIFTVYGRTHINILNQFIELYQTTGNEAVIGDMYNHLKKYFNEKEIEAILNDHSFYVEGSQYVSTQDLGYQQIKPGLQITDGINYDAYEKRKNKSQEKAVDQYREKNASQTLQIMSQLEGTDFTRKNELGFEGFEVNVGTFQVAEVPHIMAKEDEFPTVARGMRNQDPAVLDIKCYKIYLPFNDEPIHLETKLALKIPPEKKDGKTRVVLSFLFPNPRSNTGGVEFGYAYKDENTGSILVEDINGKLIKTITKEEQDIAKDEKNNILSEFFGNQEMQQIDNSLSEFHSDFKDIKVFLDKHTESKLGDEDEIELKNLADNFIRKNLIKYESSIGKWREQVAFLRSIPLGASGNSELDYIIVSQIKSLEGMIDFFDPNKRGGSNAAEFFRGIIQMKSNDGWREQNGQKIGAIVISIVVAVGAVLLAVPSGGSSLAFGTMAISAIVGTTAGVITFKAADYIIEEGKGDIVINGHRYEYKNTSELAALERGEISQGQFFYNLGYEIIVGSAITFATMGAGKVIGNGLSKVASGSSRFSGTANFMIKGLNNLKLEGVSNRMSNLISKSSKLTIKNNFATGLVKETGQELVEEGTQMGLETIHPALGFLAALVTCTPTSSSKANISLENSKVNMLNANIVDGIGTHTFSYQKNSNQSDLKAIQGHYESLGYKMNYNENSGKYVFEKDMEGDMLVKSEDGSEVLFGKHRIELVPTNATDFVCSNSDILEEFDFKINHDVENEVTYENISQLMSFRAAVETSLGGTLKINPDGTATLETPHGVINIAPEVNVEKLQSEITELEAKKQELLDKKNALERQQINTAITGFTLGDINSLISKGNKVSIGGVKYQFIGIKNNQATFVSMDGKKQVKGFETLQEMQDAGINFNLKNTPSINGKNKQNIFQEMLNNTNEGKSIEDIQSEIESLQNQKTELESEISSIENNSYSKNKFFEENKQKLIGQNFWRDGQRHTIGRETQNGDLLITNNEDGTTFTVSSFNQLSEKGGIQFFKENNNGKTTLTKKETELKNMWNDLKAGEEKFVENRNSGLESKKQELESIEQQLGNLESEQNKLNNKIENNKFIEEDMAKINEEIENINKQIEEKNNILEKQKEKNKELTIDEKETPAPEVASEVEPTSTETESEVDFDEQIFSEEGITVGGKNYKLVYEPNMTQNQNKKGTRKWIVDGKTETSVKGDPDLLPFNSDGNRIRQNFNGVRQEFNNEKNAGNNSSNNSVNENLANNTKNNEAYSNMRKDRKISEGLSYVFDENRDFPDAMKNRYDAKPEYDAYGNPKGDYKKSIENMQTYLRENGFYLASEISTSDGKMGTHTENALNRFTEKFVAESVAMYDSEASGILEATKLSNFNIKAKAGDLFTKMKTNIKSYLNLKSKVGNKMLPNIKAKLNKIWSNIQTTHLNIKIRNFKDGDLLKVKIKSGAILTYNTKPKIEEGKINGSYELNGNTASNEFKVSDIDGMVIVKPKPEVQLETLQEVENEEVVENNNNELEVIHGVGEQDFSDGDVIELLVEPEVEPDMDPVEIEEIVEGEVIDTNEYVDIEQEQEKLSREKEIQEEIKKLKNELSDVMDWAVIIGTESETRRKAKISEIQNKITKLEQEYDNLGVEEIVEGEVIDSDNKYVNIYQEQEYDNLGVEEIVEGDLVLNGNGLIEVNTQKKAPNEVIRSSEVVAVGDLHGEYIAFKSNLENAGIVDVNGNWVGGNRKVIFQGDILADRGTDGLKILSEINKLRKQAQEVGGDIDIIVGNHEDFMISFLTGREMSLPDYKQMKGLGELKKFTEEGSSGNRLDDVLSVINNRSEILENMRNSTEGRIILEEICNMKVVSQVNDILILHTNPTDGMLQYLTNGDVQANINTVNENYQGYLRQTLLGEQNTHSFETYNEISDIFLHTNNRVTSQNSKYYDILNNSGINYITHGHNSGAGKTIKVGNIQVIDNDYGFGRGGNIENTPSVSTINKNGEFISGIFKSAA